MHISGGIRSDLEREYPAPEYEIKVSHITSAACPAN